VYFWWLSKKSQINRNEYKVKHFFFQHYNFCLFDFDSAGNGYHIKFYSEYMDGLLQYGEDNLEVFGILRKMGPHRPDFIFINQ